MAIDVKLLDDRVVIALSGWDRLMCWRSKVVIDRSSITSAHTADRSSLERLIDHRSWGRGTHDGSQRPNRHRVGSMIGRDVTGKQFWAAPAGPPSAQLLVLDLRDHEFARAVLAIESAETIAVAIDPSLPADNSE